MGSSSTLASRLRPSREPERQAVCEARGEHTEAKAQCVHALWRCWPLFASADCALRMFRLFDDGRFEGDLVAPAPDFDRNRPARRCVCDDAGEVSQFDDLLAGKALDYVALLNTGPVSRPAL